MEATSKGLPKYAATKTQLTILTASQKSHPAPYWIIHQPEEDYRPFYKKKSFMHRTVVGSYYTYGIGWKKKKIATTTTKIMKRKMRNKGERER